MLSIRQLTLIICNQYATHHSNREIVQDSGTKLYINNINTPHFYPILQKKCKELWPHLTTTSVALRWESRHWWLRTWATVTVWITRVSSAVETWCRAGVVSDTSDCILCLYDWLTEVCVNLFCALSLDLIWHRRSITIAICLCLQLKERGKHWVVYHEFIFWLSELPTLFHGEDNIYCWVLNTREWSLSSYHLVRIQACTSMLRN